MYNENTPLMCNLFYYELTQLERIKTDLKLAIYEIKEKQGPRSN
jgi:hypothetical protein